MEGQWAPAVDGVDAHFRHSALLHDGDAGLAAWAVPAIMGALDRDESVMLCLHAPAEVAVRGELGAAAAAVTWLDADARFARPGVAMSIAHRFACDAAEAGGRVARSIWTLPLAGDDRDRRWVRYEQGLHDVLAGLPLHAVCTYDTSTTSTELLDAALRTHDLVEGVQPTSSDAAGAPDPNPMVGAPNDRPDLVLIDQDLASMRRALATCFEADIDRRQLDDLLLVASELMTNSLRHGRSPVTLRAWAVDDAIVLEAGDHGDAPIDRYADFRPLRGGVDGGYGLWLVGQLADWVDIESGRHVVRAAVRPRDD